jgi:hypothetical protein
MIALAAVEHLDFHVLERQRDLDRVDRLGFVGGCRQHPHLVDGTRIEQLKSYLARIAFSNSCEEAWSRFGMPSPTATPDG